MKHYLAALVALAALPALAGTSIKLGEGSTSGGGHTFEDEGVAVAQRSNANFTGAGVTVTDSGGKTVVSIPGAGGSAVVVERGDVSVDPAATNLDFLAADFAVSSSPAGEANISIDAGITRDAEAAAAYQPLDSDLTTFASSGILGLAAGGTGTNTSGFGTGVFGLLSGVFTDIDTFGEWVTAHGVTGTCNSTTFVRGDGTCNTPAGSGDVVGPASATDNAIARYDTTTGKLIQNSGVTVDDNGAIAIPSTGGITIAANATAGQYIEICEDADLGASCLRQDLGSVNLTSNVTHTPDTGGKYNGDTFLGAGTVSTALTAAQRTRKVAIPVLADSTGSISHVDLRAFFSVGDSATLVRVSCWTGQANGFSVDVVERSEATPTTGTTGSLTSAVACDTDSQASTSFTDSALDADDLVFLDITTESLTAGEFGGVTIEYTIP